MSRSPSNFFPNRIQTGVIPLPSNVLVSDSKTSDDDLPKDIEESETVSNTEKAPVSNSFNIQNISMSRLRQKAMRKDW